MDNPGQTTDSRHDSGAKSANSALARELLDGLTGVLASRKLTPWQRLSAVISGAALIFLLVCYAGAMLSMIWFTADYLISHARLLADGRPVGWYIALGSAALAVAFLLIKPAVRIPEKHLKPVELTWQDQPLLYKYVERVSEVLQTPTPARINVELGANASASVRKLFRFGEKAQLELTLGLTLLAAFDVRHFTSIIAHELGHFARHGSMRLAGLIRAVNFWFARAIYQPDRFDIWLLVSSERNPVFWLILAPIRAVLRVGRAVLWVFMMLGGLASSIISRQDEYNSDSFAARLSGGKQAADALQRVVLLNLAQDAVLNDVKESWQEKRLPDDLPQMVVAKTDRLTPKERQGIVNMLMREQTGRMDTHPCLADRLAAMQKVGDEGVSASEQPAHVLVDNFYKLCQSASLDFYRLVLEDDFEKATIVPAETLTREHALQEESRMALERFFQGEVPFTRPVFPDIESISPPEDAEQAKARCAADRQAMLDSQKQLQRHWEQVANCEEYRYALFEVLHAVDAGFAMSPRPELGLRDTRRRSVLNASERAQGDLDREIRAVGPFEQKAEQRMISSLRLLHVPEIQQQVGCSTEQLRRLLQAGEVMLQMQAKVSRLSDHARLFVTLFQSPRQHSQRPGSYDAKIRTLRDDVYKKLVELRDALAGQPYPYEHSRKDATLADYVVEKLPEKDDTPQLAMTAIEALTNFDILKQRLMGQLAKMAEDAEIAIGLGVQEAPAYEPPTHVTARRSQAGSSSAAAARQSVLAGVVIALLMGVAGAGKAIVPRLAVLPKDDDYKPTIISASWTPPPRANVWNMGLHLYKPQTYQPTVPMNGMNRTAVNTDPWHRPPDWRTRPDMQWNRGRTNYNPNPYGPRVPGQPGYTPRPGQPGYPGRTNYPGQPGYNPRPGQPGYTGRTNYPGQPGYRSPSNRYQPRTPSYSPSRTYRPSYGSGSRYNPGSTYNRPGGYTPPSAPPPSSGGRR